ncbi:MAG: histidine phosphatase family protein [Chloroflexi bacterium]|nr:histidine phosphatase family protein [Chloroflexota bacterium]
MTTTFDGRLSSGRLILIRHGETDHNVQHRICGWTDSALSRRGEQQVECLGAYVAATYAIDRLYASPLQRAWRTAAAIAARTGRQPHPVDDLREIHFGEIEGQDAATFAAGYPALYARWQEPPDQDLCWPGGESRWQFRERVRQVLAPLEAESRTAHVAVVSHGGVIGSYLAQRLARDGAQWKTYSVRNCSVTELAWRGDELVVVHLDRVEHLADV